MQPFIRPKTIPTPTKANKTIAAISLCLLILIWASAIYMYSIAPAKVPMHFDLKGNVDRYDNKIMLFLLPLIGTVLYSGIHYLAKKPYLLNYPQTLTETNYETAYKSATNMLYVMKLIIMVLFMAVQYVTYAAIKDSNTKMNEWVIIIPIVALVSVSIVFVTKSFKEK